MLGIAQYYLAGFGFQDPRIPRGCEGYGVRFQKRPTRFPPVWGSPEERFQQSCTLSSHEGSTRTARAQVGARLHRRGPIPDRARLSRAESGPVNCTKLARPHPKVLGYNMGSWGCTTGPSGPDCTFGPRLLALRYKVTRRHPQQHRGVPRGFWEGVVLLGISPELFFHICLVDPSLLLFCLCISSFSQKHREGFFRAEPLDKLHRAKLHRAKLHRAKLHRAKLHRAKLHRAKLHRAKLHRAKLHRAKLHRAKLHRASGTEPSYIEPSYIEPSCTEPSYIIEPSYIEPSYIEPCYIEPSYIEPSYIEPSYIELSYIEPSYIEPSGTEPSDTEPGGAAQSQG